MLPARISDSRRPELERSGGGTCFGRYGPVAPPSHPRVSERGEWRAAGFCPAVRGGSAGGSAAKVAGASSNATQIKTR